MELPGATVPPDSTDRLPTMPVPPSVPLPWASTLTETGDEARDPFTTRRPFRTCVGPVSVFLPFNVSVTGVTFFKVVLPLIVPSKMPSLIVKVAPLPVSVPRPRRSKKVES